MSRTTVQRRWRVPPPLLRDSDSPGPNGLNVLREHPSEFGGVLWKSLRGVLMWAEVHPGDRRGLFPEGASERRTAEILSVEPEEEVEEPLLTLVEVLDRPERADSQAVGLACSRIGRWAERQGAPLTALEFYQAAALACPSDAWHALQVGRALRDQARHARSEAWLQRVVGLSRQSRDWDTYIRAYIALGKMMIAKGAFPAARRNLLKAYRRAVRQGLREVEAMALHDLFVLEDECENTEEGFEYAGRAVKAYGEGHRLLPALAHDVAFVWLKQGAYQRALPIFFQVLPRVSDQHRTGVLGALAWAAGGAGDARSYEWARTELEELEPVPHLAEAWVEAARGAGCLDRWEEARTAAERAQALSQERGEAKVSFMAESVLESIESELQAQETLRQETVTSDEVSDRLARDLIQTLQARSGSSRRATVSTTS